MHKCHRCRRIVSPDPGSTPHEVCPYCSSALHCCKNCLYYDETSPYKCSESAADWVPDKEKANFCEFFEPFRAEILKKDMEMDKARAYWETFWKKAQ